MVALYSCEHSRLVYVGMRTVPNSNSARVACLLRDGQRSTSSPEGLCLDNFEQTKRSLKRRRRLLQTTSDSIQIAPRHRSKFDFPETSWLILSKIAAEEEEEEVSALKGWGDFLLHKRVSIFAPSTDLLLKTLDAKNSSKNCKAKRFVLIRSDVPELLIISALGWFAGRNEVVARHGWAATAPSKLRSFTPAPTHAKGASTGITGFPVARSRARDLGVCFVPFGEVVKGNLKQSSRQGLVRTRLQEVLNLGWAISDERESGVMAPFTRLCFVSGEGLCFVSGEGATLGPDLVS
ncbi:hypothetical protein VNO77_08981 [Canavalia gladiata]|uniref:Uncharacterized protein n=1 Tax=Canavalia gladiata TaxID=3824 RepID=A0AAN9MCM0_CANGL